MPSFTDAIASALVLVTGNRGAAASALDAANFLSLYGDGSAGNVRYTGGASPFDDYTQGTIIQSRVYQFNDLTIESDLDIPSGAIILCKGAFRLKAKLRVKPALTPAMDDLGIASGFPAPGGTAGGVPAFIKALDFRRPMPVAGEAGGGANGGTGGGSMTIRAAGKIELTDNGKITANGDDGGVAPAGGGAGGLVVLLSGGGITAGASTLEARGGKGADGATTFFGSGGGGGGVIYLIGPSVPSNATDVSGGAGGAANGAGTSNGFGGGASGGRGGAGASLSTAIGATGFTGRVFLLKAKRPELTLLIG